MNDSLIATCLSRYGRVLENESLARHTTMRLGGPARWMVFVADRLRLLELLNWLEEERIAWTMLGGGSNTVASSRGWDGVVIVPTSATIEMNAEGRVTADAGVVTVLLARRVTEAGWSGWEWGVGLPGTIGGAIVGNAGCYGGETKDGLESVEVWSAEDRGVHLLSAQACAFGYRDSRFKYTREVVLRGIWKLAPSRDQQASQTRMQSILQARKQEQPLGMSSAGCLFKNVEADQEVIQSIESVYGPIPAPARALGRIPAGWLIEKAGLKQTVCGGMRISERHANFAVQSASATVEDWLALRDHLQQEVLVVTGIKLQTEVRLLGDSERRDPVV